MELGQIHPAFRFQLPRHPEADGDLRRLTKAKMAGYVETSLNPADARSKLIRLTEAGRDFFGPVHAECRAAEASALGKIPDEQVAIAVDVLHAFREAIKQDVSCFLDQKL